MKAAEKNDSKTNTDYLLGKRVGSFENIYSNIMEHFGGKPKGKSSWSV